MSPLIITRHDAMMHGLPRYFTGQTCRRGHIAERRTDNSDCAECVRERQARQHKQRTPEQNRLRNELLAQQRREMHHDDASSNVRRALMGLGHVMNAPEARERGRYLDNMIRANANRCDRINDDAQN
jgi:hypothetical protein